MMNNWQSMVGYGATVNNRNTIMIVISMIIPARFRSLVREQPTNQNITIGCGKGFDRWRPKVDRNFQGLELNWHLAIGNRQLAIGLLCIL